MPSQWSQAPLDPVHPAGSTHVGLAVGVGAGMIRVMNPWHGFMQDATDDWWMARLCEGEVWTMAKEGAAVTTQAGQPTRFYGLVTTENPQVWHCPSTGCDVALGHQAAYAGLSGAQGQSATQLAGLPISNQYKQADGTVRQDFERMAIIYDGAKANPWQFYAAPLGRELQDVKASAAQAAQQAQQAQAAQASAEESLAQARQAMGQLQAQVASDASAIQLQTQHIAELQAQIAKLEAAQQSQPAPLAPPTSELIREAAQVFAEAFASSLAAALSASAASGAPVAAVAST